MDVRVVRKGWAWKNWCFWIMALGKRLLRVPWNVRRSNQSNLKEINTEYSLEGLVLKLQYFGHLMWRVDSFEKTLMLGKIEGKRRSSWQRMRWLDSIINSMDMNLSKLWEIVKDGGNWNPVLHRVTKNGTQLSDWTTVWQKAYCISLFRVLEQNVLG